MTGLTKSQRLLWAGQQLHPETPLYNMALAFAIEGPLDVARFSQANKQLTERCETFRTIFADERRSLLDKCPSALAIVDLTDTAEPEASAATWLKERSKRNFQLDKSLTDQALLTLSPTKSVWFLNQHHLITDGTTSGLLFDAMRKLYLGEDVELLPFDSYCQYETKVSADKADAYWKTKLKSEAPEPVVLYACSLVTDTLASKRVVVKLGAERSAKLRALALSPELRGFTEDLSMFQMLAGLVFAFIYRQTGERLLGIATPTHNRPTPVFKKTPGVFIEIFPLEVQLEEESTFLQIIGAVRGEVLTYLTHARSGQSRAELASRSQILLNVVNATFSDFADMPVQTEWLHSGHGDKQHALRIAVFDFDKTGDLNFLFDFNNETFGKKEQEWTINHFFKLVDALLADPSHPVGDVDLLTTDEREKLLKTWNETHAPFQDQTTVIDEFEERRWDHPERIAVKGPCAYDGMLASMTYEELDHRANQLANHLTDSGIGKGDHVAILLEPSLEWMVSMLAILKTGGAYLPVSPEEPSERLAWILKDTAAKLVITRHAFKDKLHEGLEMVVLDAEESAIGSAPEVPPSRAIAPEDRFYLISTSGSTGQPKAVCGRHISVLNLLADFEKRAPLPDTAPGTWWTNATFDVSVYEIWSSLLYGRTLNIIPQEERPNPTQVIDLLLREEISSAYLPAFMLPDLAATPLPHLQRLLVGVEPVQESLLGEILNQCPTLKIINGYGLAEATICCTLHNVATTEDRITPIGRPVQNLSTYLLDRHRQPVPIGAPGELYVGGIGLAEGYWNRPDLNTDRFVPSPFGSGELYRTGDLARHLPNGDLVFIGRVDQQLKIRSHRIEPGEIITALESHPAVRQAAIRAWPLHRLAAYVTTLDTVTSEELRTHLVTRLPRHMIPGHYIPLETLPTNTNGKVDTRALPEPDREAPDTTATTEPESTLAGIWADVLGLEQVGVDENFLDLGGDSIVSIRMVAQAHRRGIRITPQQIFEHQTIAALAQAATSVESSSLTKTRLTGPVPLNAIQRWFFSQGFAQPAVFNHQLFLTLDPAVDHVTLETRINRILQQHEAFRLSFHGEQQILAEETPAVTLLDMPDVDTASTTLNAPFNLDQAPLIRAAFVQPGTLVLVAHHLIIDGVSWATLADELRHEEPPPHEPIGFGTWTTALDAAAHRGDLRHEAAFWRAQQSAFPLPVDHSEISLDKNTEATRQTVSIALENDQLQQVSTPMQETLLTAVASAICEWTQSSEARIDIEGHGREASLLDFDLASTVGWFTSLYPVTLSIQMRDDARSRLENVTNRLKAIPRHGSAYGPLAFQDPEGHVDYQPSEILFNYLGQVEGEPVALVRHKDNKRTHLLEVDAVITSGALKINWHFSDRLHQRSTILRLANTCNACLESIIQGKSKAASTSRSSLDEKTMDKLANLLSKADGIS